MDIHGEGLFLGLPDCASRYVDYSGKVYHPEPLHAQSLFLFPIVKFGINYYFLCQRYLTSVNWREKTVPKL